MATRLYFPATTPADVEPAFFAAWNDTGEAGRYRLSSIKGASPSIAGTSIDWTAGAVALDRQYVSDPMPAGLLFSTLHTIKAQMLMIESNADDNAHAAMGIKVVSRDGGTVRATLKAAAELGPSTEIFTTARNKTLADGDFLGVEYTTVEGDRLVVEIGYIDFTGTTPASTAYWGETGTDLGENETDASGVAWVEFSNTITFTSRFNMSTNLSRKDLELAKFSNPLFSTDLQVNAIATASFPALGASVRNRISKVDASFSTSTVTGTLIVKSGASTIATKDIHGSGAIDFSEFGFPALSLNEAITCTLAAGGAGVTGRITSTGFWNTEF